MKNKKTKWLLRHTITVFSCVLIVALGIAFLTHADPVTTTIGENITTNDLAVSNDLAVTGNVTSGTWQGTAVATQYGGTGADFSGSTGLIKLESGTASMITDGSAYWDIAYTYSQVGHLPLAGGTLTSDLTIQETGDAKLTIYSNTNSPTEDSKLLVVQKGIDPLELFSVDEDGDVVVANDLAVTGTTTLSGNLNLSQNELKNAALEKLSSFPSSPVEGQMFWHTDNNKPYWYDADGTNPRWRTSASGATFVVAASDSLNKEGADYVCSGTADQEEIQAAIDAAGDGVKILLLDGTFWISAPITMTDKSVTLEGVGHSWTDGGTIIYLSPNSNCSMIEISVTAGEHSYFPTIRNLMLHGRKTYQTGTGHGIHIFGDGVHTVSDSKIQDVGIANCKGHGILLETGWLNSVVNVWSEYNELDGLRSTDGQPKITNSHFSWNGGHGLTLVSRYSIVTASTISQNTEEGIYIQGDETIINGCRIFYNSQPVAGSYSGIKVLSCSNVNIVNNIMDGESTQSYGISVSDSVTDIIIANNQFFANTVGGIQFWSPTNLRMFNNIGYITENSGSASVSNGDTIAHGLASTPTYINLTTSNADHIVSAILVGSANITIGLKDNVTGDAITVDETVYWEAEIR